MLGQRRRRWPVIETKLRWCCHGKQHVVVFLFVFARRRLDLQGVRWRHAWKHRVCYSGGGIRRGAFSRSSRASRVIFRMLRRLTYAVRQEYFFSNIFFILYYVSCIFKNYFTKEILLSLILKMFIMHLLKNNFTKLTFCMFMSCLWEMNQKWVFTMTIKYPIWIIKLTTVAEIMNN